MFKPCWDWSLNYVIPTCAYDTWCTSALQFLGKGVRPMDMRGYDFCCCYDMGDMNFCPFNLVFSFLFFLVIIHIVSQLVLNRGYCVDQNKLPATLWKGQKSKPKMFYSRYWSNIGYIMRIKSMRNKPKNNNCICKTVSWCH